MRLAFFIARFFLVLVTGSVISGMLSDSKSCLLHTENWQNSTSWFSRNVPKDNGNWFSIQERGKRNKQAPVKTPGGKFPSRLVIDVQGGIYARETRLLSKTPSQDDPRQANNDQP